MVALILTLSVIVMFGITVLMLVTVSRKSVIGTDPIDQQARIDAKILQLKASREKNA